MEKILIIDDNKDVLDIFEQVLVDEGYSVGYYSRVNSWNRSKVGELGDRGRGNYWANKEEHVVNKVREKTINAL